MGIRERNTDFDRAEKVSFSTVQEEAVNAGDRR